MEAKVLKVDLTKNKIEEEIIPEKDYRRYLGGSALASFYLLKELEPGTAPLSPDNILVFASNVLSGVSVPGITRYTVASKSPLTGGFGEAEAGGWWGPELKKAGYVAIVIYGKADELQYLWIQDNKVELKSARHLKGKTTGELEKIIRKEFNDKNIKIAQTGPAGEKMVRYACVLNNAKHANGRSGMGAVMGSKNLRAIAVRGTGEIFVDNEEKIKEIRKWYHSNWKDINYNFFEYGTPGAVENLNESGILPTRNFQLGTFEFASDISGSEMNKSLLKEREGCYACPIRCKRVVESSGKYRVDPYYGGPEYETIGSLGSNCGVGDLEAISKGNELCNKYGLDTISTGVAISFAMECYERGILSRQDTDGLELNFGNGEAMVEMIRKIALREGIGDILAEGVFRAAEEFGSEAKDYAMHIKGQEIPMHDPRGKTGVGLGYGISPTGADHIETPHDPSFSDEGWVMDIAATLGIYETLDPLDLSSQKVRLFSYLQKVYNLYNTIGVCNFSAWPQGLLSPDKLVELTRAVTGWNISLWELIKAGEKANTMARCFNIREGFEKEDDMLPARLFEPLKDGPLKGQDIDRDRFIEAIKEYYKMEGWDENGVPLREKLEELELEWVDI